eukprot:TRINITY_DN13661_c0_g1_i1.p2 TRINITY_DN13661_c0_g1~~TRINITY_DN13661_c0_g1_i1.p2  ORF type:complete len:271 (-),score=75.80 TRINITY_DN13661_c0_g1_i1:176-988(-)
MMSLRRRVRSLSRASTLVMMTLACSVLMRLPPFAPSQQQSSASFAAAVVQTGGSSQPSRSLFGMRIEKTPLESGGAEIASVDATRASIQHVMRFPGRMMERWMGPVNFDRASLRIDAMDGYALVASIVIQIVVGLYGATEEPEEKSGPQRWMFEVQIWLLLIATMTSCFTMMVFLLGKIYSTTALGMWKDVAFFNFQHATAHHRNQAFWSLLISCLAFTGSFSLNLYTRLKGKRGVSASLISFAVAGAMCLSIQQVMRLANTHVFDTFPN